MNTPILRLAAALVACAVPVWATATDLPTYETYSAAIDVSSDLLTGGLYTPHVDTTTVSGEVANISVSNPFGSPLYAASASTVLGSNHAYVRASTLPLGTLGTISYSGWYDTVTINGGNGTGVMQFTVQLNGTVDAGAFDGLAAYGLYASSVHPTQLADGNVIDYAPLPTNPWFLGASAVTPIAGYTIGVSPYNDTSLLFTTDTQPSPNGVQGVPALEPPKPLVDQVLAPGAGQIVNVTLRGTLTFTYGEAFYLIGGLGTGISDSQTFCTFSTDSSCTPPPKDGTGATTLDFSNSANLVSISLPTSATASFASGASYNVTAVPEPGEWAMLLVGLGLVGWRARRI